MSERWRPEGWKNRCEFNLPESIELSPFLNPLHDALIDTLRNHYEQGADAMYDMAVKPLQAENARLQAENSQHWEKALALLAQDRDAERDRYREALEKIADYGLEECPHCTSGTAFGETCYTCNGTGKVYRTIPGDYIQEIARDALEETS